MSSVLVTGASRGLGLGIAARLAKSGFRVIAIARRRSEQLDDEIDRTAKDARGELHFEPFDLSDIQAIPSFVKSLRKTFGAPYGLVNNAGIGTAGILSNMPDKEIESLIRLNILSPIVFTKYTVRGMIISGGGRVVNLSSVVAKTGYSGLSVYSASKAAFIGFTHSLAREIGKFGVTVNNVAPGFVDTEMTQELSLEQRSQIVRRSALKRMANISDVANAVDFLFSEKAANITGTTLTVDAGNTA